MYSSQILSALSIDPLKTLLRIDRSEIVSGFAASYFECQRYYRPEMYFKIGTNAPANKNAQSALPRCYIDVTWWISEAFLLFCFPHYSCRFPFMKFSHCISEKVFYGCEIFRKTMFCYLERVSWCNARFWWEKSVAEVEGSLPFTF